MARVTHTAQTLDAAGYPTLPLAADSADIVFQAADATNKEQVAQTGREVIIARNSGAGARTVTITSIAASNGRTGDITAYSIGAGEVAIFGPYPNDGWRQANGMLYFEASHAEVLFAVVTLP